MSKQFGVVEFTDSESVATVPLNWLSKSGKSCSWPPTDAINVNKMVRYARDPNHATWDRLQVRLLAKSATYEGAREKERAAVFTSNLDSEEEEEVPKRKRKPNPKYESLSESSQDGSQDMYQAPEDYTCMARSPTPPKELAVTRNPRFVPTSSSQRSETINRSASTSYAASHNTSTRDSGLTKKLLAMLVSIQETQREHGELLNCLLKRSAGQVDPKDNRFKIPETLFPIKDGEMFKAAEAEMEKSSKFKGEMIKYLGSIGGKNVDRMTARIMECVMSSGFAMLCTILGRNHKIQLKETHLMDTIFHAVRRNAETGDATLREVEVALRKWLSGARDRDGGRKRRAEIQRQRLDTDITK